MLIDVRDPETNKLLLRYDPDCRIIQLWIKDYDKSTGKHRMVQKYVSLTEIEQSIPPPPTPVPDPQPP